MNFNFDQAMAGVSNEADKAEQQKRGLYTFEGNPMWEPAIMAEKIEKALAPVQAAVQYASDLADRAEAHADTLDAGSYADPLATVSNDVLQRMTLLAPFVREEIADATMIALANRLRAVVAHADEATKRLYLRYARVDHGQNGAGMVTKLLNQLDDAVNGAERTKWAKETEKAQGLRSKAAELRVAASQRLAALDGRRERMDRERLERVGGRM